MNVPSERVRWHKKCFYTPKTHFHLTNPSRNISSKPSDHHIARPGAQRNNRTELSVCVFFFFFRAANTTTLSGAKHSPPSSLSSFDTSSPPAHMGRVKCWDKATTPLCILMRSPSQESQFPQSQTTVMMLIRNANPWWTYRQALFSHRYGRIHKLSERHLSQNHLDFSGLEKFMFIILLSTGTEIPCL